MSALPRPLPLESASSRLVRTVFRLRSEAASLRTAHDTLARRVEFEVAQKRAAWWWGLSVGFASGVVVAFGLLRLIGGR